jgi:hypothetical protein
LPTGTPSLRGWTSAKGCSVHDLEVAYRSIAGDVYHTDPLCPIGRLIPPEWRVAGRGELPLCRACRARTEARNPAGSRSRSS